MTLPYAGILPTTLKAIADTKMRVFGRLRLECDRAGRCRLSIDELARREGIPKSTFAWGLRQIEAAGVIKTTRHGRRSACVRQLIAEHFTVTAKAAPVPECATRLATKGKARERKKEAPEAPIADATGEAALLVVDKGEGEPAPPRPSTRRAPYGVPRQPRRPRRPRRRQRATEWLAAFKAAADKRSGTAEAPPPARPAIPPPPEIIPPGPPVLDELGEPIPFPPRHVPPRQRGFTPATDILEAFYHAAEKRARARDRGSHRDVVDPLPATGRDPGGEGSDRRRLA